MNHVKVELVSMFMWLKSMFSMFYYVINIKSMPMLIVFLAVSDV